jgi:hypothetical protein
VALFTADLRLPWQQQRKYCLTYAISASEIDPVILSRLVIRPDEFRSSTSSRKTFHLSHWSWDHSSSLLDSRVGSGNMLFTRSWLGTSLQGASGRVMGSGGNVTTPFVRGEPKNTSTTGVSSFNTADGKVLSRNRD